MEGDLRPASTLIHHTRTPIQIKLIQAQHYQVRCDVHTNVNSNTIMFTKNESIKAADQSMSIKAADHLGNIKAAGRSVSKKAADHSMSIKAAGPLSEQKRLLTTQ